MDAEGHVSFVRAFENVWVRFALAGAPDGSVIFGGVCPGPLDIERVRLCNHDHDAFVVRLGFDGRVVSHRRFAGDPDASVHSVGVAAAALAPNGDALLAGDVNQPADLGAGVSAEPGIFVARYDPNFSLLALRSLPMAHSSNLDVAADPRTGDALLAGDYAYPADLGGGPLPYVQAADLFVARYGARMDHLWSVALGSDAAEYLEGFAVSPAGDALVAARLGNLETKSAFWGTAPSFVELDVGGDVSPVLGLPVEFVRDVAATPGDGRLLTGSLSDLDEPADFGTGVLEGTGYLVKLARPW
jgi:hypothetical protein